MKYQTMSYTGSIEALAAPGKLLEVKRKFEEASQENIRRYNAAVEKHKQMIVDAALIWGDGSLPVRYLRDKDVPKPPKLLNEFSGIEEKFRKWVNKEEAKRQRQRKQQQEREAYERAQAEAHAAAQGYRRRSKEARAALESCGYKYGAEFKDNAITFAKKHIEEIRPGVWQRRIERMEDLEPAWD